jgi:RNA polymerase sigma factor (sigma-70 family)
MNMKPDHELLRQYAIARSEQAFAELVKRHVNLVYSAALRQVGGDAHLAHDVAQNVFTDLARKASSLSRRESLAGWLYTSAHFAAGKIVRTEIRRREREEQFMREPPHDPAPDADWEKLRPTLDAAMHGLNETDREAVLLRYFENRPYAEVGAKLGVNENAARMRVERALEKLRALLAKRGVATTAVLASVISANAIQVAPPALAATLANASLAAAAAGTSLTLMKLMTLTKLKLGLSALVVAGAATTLVLQHQTQQQLRNQNELLHQQVAQLKSDSDDASNRLASSDASGQLTGPQKDELLRLRGEVGALRSQTNELAKLQEENRRLQASLTAAAKAHQQAAADPTVEQQQAFAIQEINISRQLVLGLIMYANDHENQFPTNFDQAGSYYGNSDFLRTNQNRFELTYQGSWTNLASPSSAIVIRETQPFMRGDKWLKTYAFADGHSEVHSVVDGNFDEWEQQHAAVPKNQ